MHGHVRFDSFEVDLAAHRLSRRGTRIRLRDQSFQVLARLLEHPGQVVSRDDLQHRLWTADVFVDFENSLNTAVARLREALHDSAAHPRYIETLPRVGYRFIAPVSTPGMALETPSAPAPKGRLVVLPFVNVSGDPSQEYFSDAMTDEIVTELSAVGPAQLAVIARTTAMHYKGTHKDVARIARELSVDWVMEGSVRRAGDRVSLTAQLIRASDQTHVFARRYDASLADIFDVERSVAQAVAHEIGIRPDTDGHPCRTGAAARLPRKPPQDLVAYNLYIQGRQYFERARSPESWVQARKYLEAAIERDPRFAIAHDALADLWWNIGFFAMAPPKHTLAVGMPHAERAVEIDDTFADAHAMLGQYRKQLDFDWNEVDREMARALELNPASAIVRRRYATTRLMPFGRFDEAISDLALALELDPLGTQSRMWLLAMFWLSRQYDRGVDQGRMLVEIDPTNFASHFVMGLVCREARRFDDGISALRKAAQLSGGSPLMLGWLGLALAESGDGTAARELLGRLRAMSSSICLRPVSRGFTWRLAKSTSSSSGWIAPSTRAIT
jgi:TolB-like protein/Tfp pilus assembly protein PilF